MTDFVLIDNQDTCLADEVSEALSDAHSADVATAYFSIQGWEYIVGEVGRLLERGGTTRFLLGMHPTSGARALLSVLRRMQHEHGKDRVVVRFIPPTDERDFHAKVYIAKRAGGATLVIGSSNLSRPGMVSNLELNYSEVVPSDSPKLAAVESWFNRLFHEEARSYRWETIEELFSLEPYEPTAKSTLPGVEANYTEHFIALQLRHLRIPLGGRITPFFYQIEDVKAIVDEFEERLGGRRGKMLAHEVGLGKTIVAGLVIKELIERNKLERILILCPASLAEQWQQEMLDKMDEPFEIISSRRLRDEGELAWRKHKQAITSIDLLKGHMLKRNPDAEARRQEPYILREEWPDDLRYDLIVCDESHYVKSNTSMRYKAMWQLVQQLHDRKGFTLLLTATPVMNREEELYYQLVLTYPEMLRQEDGTLQTPARSDLHALGDQWEALRRESIRRKLRSEDDIKDLFAERKKPEDVAFEMSADEAELYEEFASYIGDESEYYRLLSLRAQQGDGSFLRIVPFIKTTYLREFCSSSSAIAEALVGEDERDEGGWRLERAWSEERTLDGRVGGSDEDAKRMGLKGKILKALRDGYIEFGQVDQSDLAQIEATQPDLFEQIESVDENTFHIQLTEKQLAALKDEVARINDFARRCRELAPFAKEGAFTRRIAEILEQGTESTPRKIVVFVSYLPTGKALTRMLKEAGIRAAFYQGGLNQQQRKKLIDQFWGRVEDSDEIDVLLATDAGGVGLNLQVANHVINYDLSWNPMVVEQRIGRVHRLGQRKTVFVENWFACSSDTHPATIEEDLHHTLEEKINLIRELGIDLSDEVIAEELLADSELAAAELRLQAKVMSEEEYEEIVQEVVERKAEELKELSDLKTLVTVTDEKERERAVEQALLFDRYVEEVFELLKRRYAQDITPRADGSMSISLMPDFPDQEGLPGTDRRQITIDREVAERGGDRVELFGVRHPWMRTLISEQVGEERPLRAEKEVRLEDLKPLQIQQEAEKTIEVNDLREALDGRKFAHQLNFLITHQVRQGDDLLDPVTRLYTVLLFDDGAHVDNEIINGKLNLVASESRTLQEDIDPEFIDRGRKLANEELDRIISEVNRSNESDVAIRQAFQGGRQQAQEESLMENIDDLRQRIIPKLRQGKAIAGYNSVEQAKADLQELIEKLERLLERRQEITEQQQQKFEEARQIEVVREDPELVSYCRYEIKA